MYSPMQFLGPPLKPRNAYGCWSRRALGCIRSGRNSFTSSPQHCRLWCTSFIDTTIDVPTGNWTPLRKCIGIRLRRAMIGTIGVIRITSRMHISVYCNESISERVIGLDWPPRTLFTSSNTRRWCSGCMARNSMVVATVNADVSEPYKRARKS